MFRIPQRPGEAPALLPQHLRAVLHLAGSLGGTRGPRPAKRRGRLALLLSLQRGLRGCSRAGRGGPAEPGAAADSLAGRHGGARCVRLQSTSAPILRRLARGMFLVHCASPELYMVTSRTQSQCVMFQLWQSLCIYSVVLSNLVNWHFSTRTSVVFQIYVK